MGSQRGGELRILMLVAMQAALLASSARAHEPVDPELFSYLRCFNALNFQATLPFLGETDFNLEPEPKDQHTVEGSIVLIPARHAGSMGFYLFRTSGSKFFYFREPDEAFIVSGEMRPHAWTGGGFYHSFYGVRVHSYPKDVHAALLVSWEPSAAPSEAAFFAIERGPAVQASESTEDIGAVYLDKKEDRYDTQAKLVFLNILKAGVGNLHADYKASCRTGRQRGKTTYYHALNICGSTRLAVSERELSQAGAQLIALIQQEKGAMDQVSCN